MILLRRHYERAILDVYLVGWDAVLASSHLAVVAQHSESREDRSMTRILVLGLLALVNLISPARMSQGSAGFAVSTGKNAFQQP